MLKKEDRETLLCPFHKVSSGWLALDAIAGVTIASRNCRKVAMSSGMVEMVDLFHHV